ncbi:hypothetical protein BH11PLA2_BH11PLA2_28100 [soil metagenome]
MKFRAFAMTLAALLTSDSVSSAAFLTTSPVVFASILAPIPYTNDFSTVTSAPSTPYPLSGNGYVMNVTAPSGQLYLPGGPNGFLGANVPTDSLTLTFTSGNVSAVAANFYLTDITDAFVAAPVTVTLNDLTTTTFTPTSNANGSFAGFYAPVGSFILSLTMPVPTTANAYNGFDNLIVGTSTFVPSAGEAVPVPATALLGFAAMPLIGLIRRKRA